MQSGCSVRHGNCGTCRDNGQDTAIQDAQHAANWASMKADDAQHAIMVAQTDIDANKAAIADTRNDVSAVQSDVTNIKGDVAHAQSTADHANANANTNSAAFFVRKMQRLQADNILRNAQHRVKK